MRAGVGFPWAGREGGHHKTQKVVVSQPVGAKARAAGGPRARSAHLEMAIRKGRQSWEMKRERESWPPPRPWIHLYPKADVTCSVRWAYKYHFCLSQFELGFLSFVAQSIPAGAYTHGACCCCFKAPVNISISCTQHVENAEWQDRSSPSVQPGEKVQILRSNFRKSQTWNGFWQECLRSIPAAMSWAQLHHRRAWWEGESTAPRHVSALPGPLISGELRKSLLHLPIWKTVLLSVITPLWSPVS